MSTTSISGGGNHNVMVYGSATVVAGDGNDRVTILGVGNVTLGNGSDTVAIVGNGTVSAGSGNDSIRVNGGGSISVGGGSDTLTLNGSGQITESGMLGADTINLGLGDDTIYTQGSATVSSANLFQRVRTGRAGFNRGMGPTGSGVYATVAGGELEVRHVGGVTQEIAVSGSMTLLGGVSPVEFVGGSGATVMRGGSGSDTFIGGSGSDTMTGGSGSNLFEFLTTGQGGQHVDHEFRLRRPIERRRPLAELSVGARRGQHARRQHLHQRRWRQDHDRAQGLHRCIARSAAAPSVGSLRYQGRLRSYPERSAGCGGSRGP